MIYLLLWVIRFFIVKYPMSFLQNYHISYILVSFATFLVIANLLTQRKKPSSMIAWIIVIVTFPYFGILLYLIFHDRKMKRVTKRMKKLELKNQINQKEIFDCEVSRLIYENGKTYPTFNRNFYLCKDAFDSYNHIVGLINGAKESIYICTYILGNDDLTKNIIKFLSKKAKNGVEVKLLIDAVGSQLLELNPSFLKELEKSGGEYIFFMSLLKKPFSSKLNLRNHRKMIVVDHTKLLSGGINLSSDYLQDKALQNKKVWVDIAFVLEGAAALDYEEVFLHNWMMEGGEIKKRDIDSLNYKRGNHLVQVVPSGPDVANDTLYESLLLSIFEAKKRVWIISPYFAPESSLMDALIVAKHRGVEIKIISPKSSDHLFVDIARSAFLRELHDEGIEVLFYKSTMLHAKAVIIDEHIAILGSANFDSRSFFYNFEIVSFFYTTLDVKIVTYWVQKLFDECEYGLKPASLPRKLIENLFKLLAPAL